MIGPANNRPPVGNTAPIDMRDRIKDRCGLAQTYAEDGAYYSAARVLRELWQEVSEHAQRVDPSMARRAGGGK